MTPIRVNKLFAIAALTVLQVYIVWAMQGQPDWLQTLVGQKDLLALAMVFSPTAGLVWVVKHLDKGGE